MIIQGGQLQMFKRIYTVLLVLVLSFVFVGQNICVVDAAISTTTFNSKVQEFVNDSRWKNGISWGDNQAPKLSKWSSVGCCAYAADFVAYVYGSATAAWTASGFTKFTNLNEIRVGDVIHITGHWFVVIERNGDNFKTVEGNVDDKVRVSSDAWGIKNGKIHHLKASSSEHTFEYGYHYNFSDSNSSNLSSTQIYYNIDMSSSVLASRTNQQVSGDCAVVSMVTVESYLYGAKTAAGKNAVYKALVNKNGDDNYAYWSNCGYVSHSSVNWATVYEQLSIGYPVIVHRPATSSNSQHWAVVAGYKGSTTKLEKDKFIIVDVYHGSGSKDIYTSAEWRGSVAIDRMVTRKNGMKITSLTGIRMAIDHPATVHQNGAGHGVLGYITSNENLLSVTVTVTNANTGANVYNKTITPNAKSYLIYNLDSEMTFAKWAVGEYFFTVVAKTAEQTRAYQSYFQITKGWPLSLPKRSYNFNFNNNGGSGNVTSQLVYYGDKLTIPTTTPTRNGYKFVGWTVVRSTDNTSYYSKGEWLSNNQAGSSDAKKIYKPGDVYSINYDWVKGSFTNRNYTFYAVWEANPEYLTPLAESNIVVDDEIDVVFGIAEQSTSTNVIAQFENADNIQIIGKDGKLLGGNALVGTGCKVQLIKNGEVKDETTVVIKGDIDGNGKVNSDDAVYLLRNTLFAAIYPVVVEDDVDGSGNYNSNDAIYLLRHTLFPSMYPLK